jgi:hypothetical protein
MLLIPVFRARKQAEKPLREQRTGPLGPEPSSSTQLRDLANYRKLASQ